VSTTPKYGDFLTSDRSGGVMADWCAGIDVGSLFLKIVRFDERRQILDTFYHPHYGESIDLLKRELGDYSGQVAITGTNTELLESLLSIQPVNHIQSTIEYVRGECPDARNIIDIGGNSATYIELTEDGRFKHTTGNSICAAGTGSFLDEQLERLELTYRDLESIPIIESPPRIAARCSVFAKTDLIHRQQQGYSREEMWAGLCQGMVQTCLTTLLKGKKLEGSIVMAGGVSLNDHIGFWMKRKFGERIHTFPLAHRGGCGEVSR
jgi:activator of 2-hydroxyglutaryl-CoA dehydratase